MLTPNELHLLTGILTMAAVDHDVELELGSAMIDAASGTQRDIDITLRYRTAAGPKAVTGIEVKAHSRPLDIEHVEQLIIKLKDVGLPGSAIVSASGYTAAAVKKATAHGIELLSLTHWSSALEKFDTPFRGTEPLLLGEVHWTTGPHVHIELDFSGPLRRDIQAENCEVWIQERDDTFSRRSVDVLIKQVTKAAEDVALKSFPRMDSPGVHDQPVAHAVTFQNSIRLIFPDKTVPVKFIGVAGRLAETAVDGRDRMRFLVTQDGGALVASCCVMEMQDGRLTVMAFDPVTRQLTPHTFSVSERTRSKIRGLPLVRQTAMHRVCLNQMPKGE